MKDIQEWKEQNPRVTPHEIEGRWWKHDNWPTASSFMVFATWKDKEDKDYYSYICSGFDADGKWFENKRCWLKYCVQAHPGNVCAAFEHYMKRQELNQ